MALPAKLADCQIHDGFSETYVCEGDSAGNSIKLTRNKVFQACLPLRGKILNVNKAELSKILSAESVKGIIASLGTGIGKNFDISKLRYNKIIIATDADID
jgi:DNA gyrase subunit B